MATQINQEPTSAKMTRRNGGNFLKGVLILITKLFML